MSRLVLLGVATLGWMVLALTGTIAALSYRPEAGYAHGDAIAFRDEAPLVVNGHESAGLLLIAALILLGLVGRRRVRTAGWGLAVLIVALTQYATVSTLLETRGELYLCAWGWEPIDQTSLTVAYALHVVLAPLVLTAALVDAWIVQIGEWLRTPVPDGDP